MKIETKGYHCASDVTTSSTKGLAFTSKNNIERSFSAIGFESTYGKMGRWQVVGPNVKGEISEGGGESVFEEIIPN